MQHHAVLYEVSVFTDLPLDQTCRAPAVDVVHINSAAFGIADARALQQQAWMKPVKEAHRVFVVFFHTATVEAQNALLKLFEDPPQTSRFIVGTPDRHSLLPTLRSRLELGDVTKPPLTQPEFSEWISLSVPKRLQLVTNKLKAKDTVWLQAMKSGLVRYARDTTCSRVEAKSLLFVSQWLGKRGASNKLLLEELALTVPVGVKDAK